MFHLLRFSFKKWKSNWIKCSLYFCPQDSGLEMLETSRAFQVKACPWEDLGGLRSDYVIFSIHLSLNVSIPNALWLCHQWPVVGMN